MKNKTVLITGIAGFIGYSLAKYLVETTNLTVIGVDNLNEYYDIQLKNDRLLALKDKIVFIKQDINQDLSHIFQEYKIDVVVNLAAQAGVRYSKVNPDVYIEANIDGFYNLISTAQRQGVQKIIYASSSSIYGSNKKLPFCEGDRTATPMSLYAATKLADENIASGFFYSFGMRTIGLRFFNIYGPFGRPDMAYFKWTKCLSEGRAIELNDGGEMWRDMTFIDDCVKVIKELIYDESVENKPEIYNVGNKDPVKIADLLEYISEKMEVKPNIIHTHSGLEEPIKTWADTSLLEKKIGFSPATNYKYGIDSFLGWYKGYYG